MEHFEIPQPTYRMPETKFGKPVTVEVELDSDGCILFADLYDEDCRLQRSAGRGYCYDY